MKTFGRRLALLLLPLALLLSMALVLFSACDDQPQDPPDDPNSEYAFVFTGTGETASGRTFNFTMTGSKEDDSLEIVAQENRAIRVDGRYELLEGKGYKIYVNDTSGANGYARYNDATDNFTITLSLVIGNYGTVPVEFTYHDPDFAYDGIGITEPDPPLFENCVTIGAAVGDGFGSITCTVDGTFSATATTGGGWIETRTGTYEYDAENDKYLFTFDDAVFATFDTYDPQLWQPNDYRVEAIGPVDRSDTPTREEIASEYDMFNNTYEAVWSEEHGYYWMEYQSIWRFANNMGWIVDMFATYTPAE